MVAVYVDDTAAVQCDVPATPMAVPYPHSTALDEGGEATIGGYLFNAIVASNPAKYTCNALGACPAMPAGCTFGISFNDGWFGTGQVTGGFCWSAWLTISAFQPPPNSPILLDLDRNQFHLSSGPVYFDIDADGESESIAWTSAGEFDAFLFLDRNGNGVVDDGSELLGNATPLVAGGVAQNGYEALAEFDLPDNGGVDDGVIDGSDSVFANLRVWIDMNADGISEPHETLSLSDAGVLAIELEYTESPRTDEHGNEFRYLGRGWTDVDGQAKKMWVTDVFFNSLEE